MSHRRSYGTRPERVSYASSCPSWSFIMGHSCLRQESSLFSFWLKRILVSLHESLKHKGFIRSLRQFIFCADNRRRAHGTLINKGSSRFTSKAEGGREVGQWVIPVLASSSQVSGLVHHSQGSPAHFRETSAADGKGHVTHYGSAVVSFHTWASQLPFPELEWSIPVPFCHQSLLSGLSPGFSSWLTGQAMFLY